MGIKLPMLVKRDASSASAEDARTCGRMVETTCTGHWGVGVGEVGGK